jgi:hypothetical protein
VWGVATGGRPHLSHLGGSRGVTLLGGGFGVSLKVCKVGVFSAWGVETLGV